MKDWFDLSIKERIRSNNEQGFTADNIWPPGTETRKRFDKMCEDTMKNFVNMMFRKEHGLENVDLMKVHPDRIYTKKKEL